MEVEDEPKAGAPDWIVTFADLMSLLLTFFVLLLSFSTTEISKFKQIAGSLKDALGMRSELELSDIPQSSELLPAIETEQATGQATAEQLEKELQAVIEEIGVENQGEAKLTDEGIVLQLSGDYLFESGRADINEVAYPLLDQIAAAVLSSGRSLDVAGHTDDVPIATAQFPSNWELSAARAGQAVRYFTEHGVEPQRLRAIGRGEAAPIADNSSAEGRAENRRIEFIFTLQDLKPRSVPLQSTDETPKTAGAQGP